MSADSIFNLVAIKAIARTPGRRCCMIPASQIHPRVTSLGPSLLLANPSL